MSECLIHLSGLTVEGLAVGKPVVCVGYTSYVKRPRCQGRFVRDEPKGVT